MSIVSLPADPGGWDLPRLAPIPFDAFRGAPC